MKGEKRGKYVFTTLNAVYKLPLKALEGKLTSIFICVAFLAGSTVSQSIICVISKPDIDKQGSNSKG